MVLEFVEKFPQCLYDAPGGSPFGFQLLTRRLRFRLEFSNQNSDPKEILFADITNRSVKCEPLVSVAALKSYLYEHITNKKLRDAGTKEEPSSSKAISHLNYGRPPTAASLRSARKLPKAIDKSAGGTSFSNTSLSAAMKHNVAAITPGDVLSARSAYLAAGCLERVGGNIKVKQSGGGKAGAGAKAAAAAAKKAAALGIRAGKAATKMQRQHQQRDLSGLVEAKNGQCATTQKATNEGGSSGGGNGNIGQQQQKSMSTTNLFDADRRKIRSSSVAFNQAASAESLQHQTPSLENLLSKARLHDCSIPEESMGSPNSGSPEPKNLTTFENLPHFETRFEKRKGSEDVQTLSIGASSFAGGSQPVLNSSSFSRDRSQVSSSERLEPNQIGSSIETINEVKAEDEGTNPMSTAFDNTQSATIRDNSLVNAAEYDAEMENDEEEEDAGEVIPGIKETENLFSLLADGIAESEMSKNKEEKDKMSKTDTTIISAGESSSSRKVEPQQPLNQHDSEENSNSSSQLQNIGTNIRVKLGSYAEVLRNMMQHVLETGDNSDIYDVDEFDNDIYEDEMHFIECEHPDGGDHGGFGISADPSSYIDHHHHFGTHPDPIGPTEPPSNILGDSQLDSLTNPSGAAASSAVGASIGSSRAAAVAAIRAAMERSSDIPSIPIDMLIGAAGGGVRNSNHAEMRHQQRWRQILMDEFDSHMPTMGIPSDGTAKQRAACDMGGCARTIRGCVRTAQMGAGGGWNDDFVLRRQFGALIPAFDPRPGRTNVNQTQDVEVPTDIHFSTYKRKGSLIQEDSKTETSSATEDLSQSMLLSIKMANKNPLKSECEETIELTDNDASLFHYVQELLLANQRSGKCVNSDSNSHIWDQTFTLVYGNSEKDSATIIDKNCKSDEELMGNPLGFQALNVVKILNELTQQPILMSDDTIAFPPLSDEIFHSTKLTQRLCQELTDPLVVSAKTLPNWCNYLVRHFPCLFSVDTRILYLNTTAFGTSRAIGYLQSRRDQLLEQNRSATASAGSNLAGLRREDHYPEYRIGRIKHERIKVHRSEGMFLENAINVLKFHALRKAILEIEYHGEEGTGLGPTLEFFGLVAAQFQRKDLCMWQCEHIIEQTRMEQTESVEDEQNVKPSGYYVHSNAGLFPTFWPSSAVTDRLLELFQIFGVFLAKAIQDNRLVDLPLSKPFVKLMTSPKLSSGDQPSIESVLDINDFAVIYPEKAKLLKALMHFIARRKAIQSNSGIDQAERAKMLTELLVEMDGSEFSVEDLSLTFALNPPAECFPYNCAELIEDGASVEVDSSNVEIYIQKLLEFHLDKGIQKQLCAFRHGFDMVFPLSTLGSFSTTELQTLLSGEQYPKWSREDLLRFTDPKLGYTRDSPGFLNFVDVLTNYDAVERKAFLQFTTGCSSLPPGGLANLHPRLTIVRKIGSGDGSYPSVNTCVHYLKLPEYSCADVLRERLLAATREKGFHLN